MAAEVDAALAAASAHRDGFRPWRPLRGGAPGLAISWRFVPGADAPELYLALDTPLDPATVAGLVIWPELSGLAGSLLRLERQPLAPGAWRLGYRVALPRPLAPRAFGVVQRTTVDARGCRWITSRHEPAAAPAEPGDVVGAVRISDYRIRPRPGGGARFERLQSVGLGLPWPRAWLGALRRHLLVDARILLGPVTHAEALSERLAEEPSLAP